MQLTDGAWTFNTEDIDSAINTNERNWYERELASYYVSELMRSTTSLTLLTSI